MTVHKDIAGPTKPGTKNQANIGLSPLMRDVPALPATTVDSRRVADPTVQLKDTPCLLDDGVYHAVNCNLVRAVMLPRGQTIPQCLPK